MNNPPDTNQSLRYSQRGGQYQPAAPLCPPHQALRGVGRHSALGVPEPQLGPNTDSPSGSDAFWARPGWGRGCESEKDLCMGARLWTCSRKGHKKLDGCN